MYVSKWVHTIIASHKSVAVRIIGYVFIVLEVAVSGITERSEHMNRYYKEISHQNRSSTRPIADSLSTPENACHYEATFYFAIHKPTIICIPAIRKVCLRSRRRLPHCRLQMAPSSQRRLTQLLNELKETPGSIGNLRLGDITYEIPASLQPSRLARSSNLLDINDPVNLDNLHFLLQKYLLGQDIFLVSQPGPYARRLALTFAR